MKNVILLFVILFNSCNKESSSTQLVNGVAVSLPHLWVQSTNSDNNNSIVPTMTSAIIYNGNTLISGIKNGVASIIFVNSSTGEKIWEWQDWIVKRPDVSFHKPYLKNNLLFLANSYWNYCIDLNTGKSVFKNGFNSTYSAFANGLGDYTYSTLQYDKNKNNYPESESLYRTSIINGIPEFLITPKFDSTNNTKNPINYGGIGGITPFTSKYDTLLAASLADFPNNNRNLSFCIYNLTQKKWIIERKLLTDNPNTSLDQVPQIVDNKIYICMDGYINCNDALTGNFIWKTSIGNGGFLFSGFIIQNGKVYAQPSDGTLHCLDANTGSELWVEKTSGSSSDMVYLDGVIYFVGGGDGYLHAVDAQTGKHIWIVKSEDELNHSDGFFNRFCAAVPGTNGSKGHIIVTTIYNAYCYEAAK